MIIVIDANKLFSIIISGGNTLELLYNPNIEVVAPEYLVDELNEHLKEIILKSKLSREEIFTFIVIISNKIRFYKTKEYIEYLNRSIKLVTDLDDIDYFALALKLNCSIWSEDKEFKKQNKVKVFNTKELMDEIKKF